MKYQFTVPESKRVRVIVSTDAACEADDPFAIAHALLSPKLDVKAVVAEHFMCEGSMERSHAAAKRLLDLMGSDVPVLHGQAWPKVPDEVSEGAQCIIDEARRDDPRRLFVLCMGAMTTAAAALAAAPDIHEKLTIVTTGRTTPPSVNSTGAMTRRRSTTSWRTRAPRSGRCPSAGTPSSG